jgi:FtsP/CotA-like multicopper oxidase with cupredoxin domain
MSDHTDIERRTRKGTMTRTPRRLGLGLVLAAALATLSSSAGPVYAAVQKTGMICTNGSLSGTTRTFHLVAKSGHVQTPDGNSLLMWSYANGDASGSPFQEPGPVLCANQGETVNVILTDNLTIKNSSGGTDPVNTSIVFPGQEGVAASGGSAGLLTTEASNGGGAVTYSFTAGQPGTYLYESGTDVTMQIEMGLYGALIIRPTGAGFGPSYAYDNASTKFSSSREYLLLLSDIDPDLHHAVETGHTYDFTTKHDRYYMINGRDFPDTVQDNGTPLLPDQPYGALVRIEPNSAATNPDPALIRMINVGTDPHPFHPHGNHTRQISQDGRLLLSPGGSPATTEHFGETIGSGETRDYLLRWDDVDQWDPNTNPLPVAQPNYRNLTFKDSTTWYAGNPYLGYKGTLPVGTNDLNICGEWYFPLHSHALNEFSNFNEGFGGMGTLLRVDPPGGCFTSPSGTTLVGGKLKSGAASALRLSDGTYYQVNPASTTKTGTGTLSAGATSLTVASNTGFPAPPYYVRADNEVLQVTARSGTGNLTWTVSRAQLGSLAASHAANVTLTALATDWYASFSGVVTGASNLSVTYAGKNCANTTGTGCTALTTNLPQQTVKICDWTIGGAAGCATATSAGWVTLPAPQNIGVGSAGASNTWSAVAPFNHYVGTGSNRGQVRVLVHTQRWTAANPTAFST